MIVSTEVFALPLYWLVDVYAVKYHYNRKLMSCLFPFDIYVRFHFDVKTTQRFLLGKLQLFITTEALLMISGSGYNTRAWR